MELCIFDGGCTFSDNSRKDTHVFYFKKLKRVYVDTKRCELCVVCAGERTPTCITARCVEQLERWWKNMTLGIENEGELMRIDRTLREIHDAHDRQCDEFCKRLDVLDQIDSSLQDISSSVSGISGSLDDNFGLPRNTKKRKVGEKKSVADEK